MQDLNSVFVIGRLVRNAEFKSTQSGTSLLNFSVATNRSKKSGEEWTDEVSYIDIVYFSKGAEKLSAFMTKGKRIGVKGKIVQNRWITESGENRSKVGIQADNIQLLSFENQENLPQSQRVEPRDQSDYKPNRPDLPPNPELFEEDIPF